MGSSTKHSLSCLSTRIALILELSIPDLEFKFTVATTHLSFPHGLVTNNIQLGEANHLIHQLANTKQPIILCGDFNAGEDSTVYTKLKLAGFASSYATIHNREPIVTHKTHRN